MRFYGRNRARMLGEELDVQEAVDKGGMLRCSSCERMVPESQFGGGKYHTCDRCRAIGAAYRKAKGKR